MLRPRFNTPIWLASNVRSRLIAHRWMHIVNTKFTHLVAYNIFCVCHNARWATIIDLDNQRVLFISVCIFSFLVRTSRKYRIQRRNHAREWIYLGEIIARPEGCCTKLPWVRSSDSWVTASIDIVYTYIHMRARAHTHTHRYTYCCVAEYDICDIFVDYI